MITNRFKYALLVLISILLSSCARNISNAWNRDTPKESLSIFGTPGTFSVLYDLGSTEEIDYSYSKLFKGYEKYSGNHNVVVDSLTANLVSEKMIKMGYIKGNLPTIEIRTKELLGWDMGEIVKKMKICMETKNENTTCTRCSEFSEMSIFNSHPRRKLVVENLITLLMLTNKPEDTPTTYSVQDGL